MTKRRPATLSGKMLNCAIWIPDQYGGWKCGGYAPACEVDKCAPLPDPKKKQVKVCSTRQKVFSPFLDKKVTRCKRYAAACNRQTCMDFTMPYPDEPSEKTMPAPAEIKSVASWMAEEYNEEVFKKDPAFAREILDRGGIRPPRGVGAEKEEYRAIPIFMRDKTGLPLDEMAAEMNYADGEALRRDIEKAYPIKKKGEWKKKKQRKQASDFIDAAYEYIEEQMGEKQWT